MQLTTSRVLIAAAAVIATPADADLLDVDEQRADYLFRYFADSDHVHVFSHYGEYAISLESDARLELYWNRESLVIPGIDAPAGSAEAVDAITTASRPIASGGDAFRDYTKVRNEVQGGVAYRRTTLGYYVSTESDYFAQQVTLRLDRDLLAETLNLAAGGSYGWDVIDPLEDADGATPADHKNTWHGNLVATIIVSPTTLLRMGGELTVVDGLQHNPYRNVYAGGGPELERHPDHRERRDLFLKLSQYFRNRSSARVDYRLYADDWGVSSRTFGARLHQYLTDALRVRYRYRYYDQSAADFHREEYESPDGIDGLRTGDYRLSAMTSHLFGTRVTLDLRAMSTSSPVLQRFELAVGYERYFNSNNFSANVFESGLTYRF